MRKAAPTAARRRGVVGAEVLRQGFAKHVRRRRGVGEGRGCALACGVLQPSPHPSIYRGRGKGGRPSRENPRVGGRPTWLGGYSTPLVPPIYSGEMEDFLPHAFGASLSLSNTSSSSIVLGEALPEYCSSTTTTPSLLLEPSSSTSPSPLLDQEGGDVTLTVRVLNTEVPSVRRLSSVIWITSCTTTSTSF